MSIGRYISLEEARKNKKMTRFIKDHPSKGNEKQFYETLDNMTFKKKPKGGKTSRKV